MPGQECSSSLKRRGPSERSWTISGVHLVAMISAVACERALRRFFEVDRHYVAVAALKELADAGTIDKKVVSQAIKKYEIDADAAPRTTV